MSTCHGVFHVRQPGIGAAVFAGGQRQVREHGLQRALLELIVFLSDLRIGAGSLRVRPEKCCMISRQMSGKLADAWGQVTGFFPHPRSEIKSALSLIRTQHSPLCRPWATRPLTRMCIHGLQAVVTADQSRPIVEPSGSPGGRLKGKQVCSFVDATVWRVSILHRFCLGSAPGLGWSQGWGEGQVQHQGYVRGGAQNRGVQGLGSKHIVGRACLSSQSGCLTRGTGLGSRCSAAGMVMIFWMAPLSRSR